MKPESCKFHTRMKRACSCSLTQERERLLSGMDLGKSNDAGYRSSIGKQKLWELPEIAKTIYLDV